MNSPNMVVQVLDSREHTHNWSDRSSQALQTNTCKIVNNPIIARLSVIGADGPWSFKLPPEIKSKCFIERLVNSRHTLPATKLFHC